MGRLPKRKRWPVWPEPRTTYVRWQGGRGRGANHWRWTAIRLPATGQVCWAWVNRRGMAAGHSMCPAGFDAAWKRTAEHIFGVGSLRGQCLPLARGAG